MTAVLATPRPTARFARVKTTLLAQGVRIDDPHLLDASVKPALRVRSGACGGLDLILPDGTYVNAPVHERFAADSPIALVREEGFVLDLGDERIPVELVPTPDYYARRTLDGIPMSRVGQLCSDRLGIGLTNICTYWRSPERRCRFCAIGLNTRSEQAEKPLAQILEVTEAAYEDTVVPARHMLLGGATPDGPDAGAARMAAVARAIKARWDQPLYAMLAPPAELRWLDELHGAGVDEVALNLELFDEASAALHTPGKHAAIGREGYLRALAHAVELFGPIATRSIMVVGLEPAESTLAGVERLASLGVMPILSPFRPMNGTALESHPRLRDDELWDLGIEAAAIAGRFGIPLGPTCIRCQSNTLTVGDHPSYRIY